MKKFSQGTFTLFAINYIVGFGFITTITSLIKLGIFGLIVFLLTSLVTLSISLVFARLSNKFNDEYGGSYLFAKKVFKPYLSFFVGWNQYIQGPILSSTAPLFLADAASYLTTDSTTIWIIRGCSIVFFMILIIISTLGLQVSKFLIMFASFFKWIILLMALALSLYLVSKDNNNSNFLDTNNLNIYLIFSNILSFMYAFGGFEDISNMAKDVKFKNFKFITMISFMFILTFYLIFYIVLIFIGTDKLNNFSQIFQLGLGSTGIIIFVVGLIFNSISSKLSTTISSARKLVAIANDGYLFSFLTRKNKKNEYKNAIWFNAFLTIVSMLSFWLIPFLLNISNFFESVINLGSIAFLVQYLFTFIIALIMEKRKIISKINIFEKIIYIMSSIIISTTLLIYIFPFIVLESWTVSNTITIVSYTTFILFGYATNIAKRIYINKKNKTSM